MKRSTAFALSTLFPPPSLWALALIAAIPFVSGTAHAQQSSLDPRTLRTAQLSPQPQPQPADQYPTSAIPRTITLQAGTGMLLRLPQPATTIMSAEPNIARVQPASPTSLFLMGVTQGRTTVIATSDNGSPIGQFDVIVTPGQGGPAAAAAPTGRQLRSLGPDAAREVQISVHRSVPGARSVLAEVAGGRLLLHGAVTTAMAAEQVEAVARGIVGEDTTIIDDMIVLGSVQVNVRVRIAEIDRTITRQLGFNWQALGAGGKWQFGLMTGAAAVANSTLSGITGGGLSVSAVPYSLVSPTLPLGVGGFQGGPAPNQIGVGFSSGKWDVNSVIDALAADQLVTILAEPNLTAQSGETASFLAGGEFPVPVAGTTTAGTATITVDFKQFGVSLALVPTVLSPTRLNLRIRPEVSQLSSTGAVSVPLAGGTLTIPALTVRRAETTVELGSGQSFAIAGLLQRNTTDVTNALPGIGEVPVIGALFKSNNFQRGESELVIIVTPYLVKPVDSPEDMHAPTDGFRPGNDADRMLLGRQMAPQPARPPLDAGFILK
jgi:pilus assembly protein CpaC